jgi:hypothetical protein
MATLGSKVTRSDYNSFYTSVSNVLGPGSGQYGYGQTLIATTTSVGTSTKITQAHWANLRLDVLRIAAHQGLSENASWSVGNTTSIPVLPSITTSKKVSADVVNKLVNAINVLNLTSNVYKLAAGQYADELLSQSIRTTQWNSTISHYYRINFGSSANARYFFNAGGSIRITPSFIKSSSTTINNDWENLINGVGTLVFNYNNTTINNSEVSSIGFYELNTTPTQIYTRTGGSQNATYAVNDYTIRVYCNVANNSNGGATSVTFECEFKDDKTYPNPSWPPGDEFVTGTVYNTARMYRPSGSNVAVTAPSVTILSNL